LLDLKFTLSGVDITDIVDKDSFPEWFEESMKGDGYFNYEVSPIVFRLNTYGSSVVPAYGDLVELTNTVTGLPMLKGKIDEIEDDESNQPQITVFPQALLLKDTIVGDETELSEGETIKEFNFTTQHIRSTVQTLLTEVNAEHGTSMYANTTSIPDSENTGKFFGNRLKTFESLTFQQFMLNLLGFTDDFYIRKNDEDVYFLIHKDGYFRNRVVIPRGEWIDENISFSVVGVSFTFGTLVAPSSDFELPTADTTNHVWRMAAGGLEDLGDFDTDSQYGNKFTELDASNLPEDKFIDFATEEGLVSEQEIIASFDYDDGNSYAIVKGKFKNDPFFSKMVISFETTFDDEYAGEYRDASALDIMRDFAVVANRWLYVDRSGLVYLLPRSETRGTVDYLTEWTLEAKKTCRKEEDVEIKIDRYSENDKGKVITYGLKLRKNELDAIKSYYRDLFSGEVTQRILTLYNTEGDDLLKSASWDNKPELETIGIVIKIEHGIIEPLLRVTVEDGV